MFSLMYSLVYVRFYVAGECVGVILRVCCRVLNDPNEVMDTVLLVVRNEEEDLGKDLTEFREM